MKLALVAMPWNAMEKPSPALGILAAVIRNNRPRDIVDCRLPYLEIGDRIGVQVYTQLSLGGEIGEMIYAGQLYPEKKASIKKYFLEKVYPRSNVIQSSPGEDLFEHIFCILEKHLEEFSTQLAGKYDVIGFTTTCAQIFSSLVAAKKIKDKDSKVKILLGGSRLSQEAGTAILELCPFVDNIISGEGELQVLEYLEQLETSLLLPRTVFGSSTLQKKVSMMANLDDLPIPDYENFAQLAEEVGSLEWIIPIEGSRGCSWSKVHHTNNPKTACRFCSNTLIPYRSKSAQRIAEEMETLSTRHSNFRFHFTDLVIRSKSAIEVAKAIKKLGKKFWFFCELRTDIHPFEILCLWEVGCREVQLGIEGFSSTYLKRIGKGTTTIQNLQAMKTCYELGICNTANLLTKFPGTTNQEIEEQAKIIIKFARIYQPLTISPFILERDSATHRFASEYHLNQIRNSDHLKVGLPSEVWSRLFWHTLDFDDAGPGTDWTPVTSAMAQWVDSHKTRRQGLGEREFFSDALLHYEDWGTSLEIVDRRDNHKVLELEDHWRELYLYCMEIKSMANVIRHFSESVIEKELRKMIADLQDAELIFVEKDHCLSLAVARYPNIAADRIRSDHSENAVST